MSSGTQPRKRPRSGSATDEAAPPRAVPGWNFAATGTSLFRTLGDGDQSEDEEEEEEPDTEDDDDDYASSLAAFVDPARPAVLQSEEPPDTEEEPDTEDDDPDLPLADLLPRRGTASVIDLTDSPPSASPPVLHNPNSTSVPSTSTSSNAPPPAAPAPALSPSLATLSCPICLGPPTPLALTSCGHAYCAPCLHAALLAGGPLTPPPSSAGMRGRTGGPRGARGRVAFFGPGASRGRGAASGGAGRGGQEEEEPPSELDGHCPVCRTVLKGGWGRSIRGLVMRMLPVTAEELTLDD